MERETNIVKKGNYLDIGCTFWQDDVHSVVLSKEGVKVMEESEIEDVLLRSISFLE
jgi:hypothetical protein